MAHPAACRAPQDGHGRPPCAPADWSPRLAGRVPAPPQPTRRPARACRHETDALPASGMRPASVRHGAASRISLPRPGHDRPRDGQDPATGHRPSDPAETHVAPAPLLAPRPGHSRPHRGRDATAGNIHPAPVSTCAVGQMRPRPHRAPRPAPVRRRREPVHASTGKAHGPAQATAPPTVQPGSPDRMGRRRRHHAPPFAPRSRHQSCACNFQ